MLIAGVRGRHDWAVSSGALQPEGFVSFDSEIRRNVRAVAEVTADAKQIAGMAGIKITW